MRLLEPLELEMKLLEFHHSQDTFRNNDIFLRQKYFRIHIIYELIYFLLTHILNNNVFLYLECPSVKTYFKYIQ